MIYIPEIDFVFIHVPKTGGSSIQQNLRRWWEHVQHVGDSQRDQHFTWVKFRSHVLCADRLDSYAIVRNPWDWLHSYYKYILSEPNDSAHKRFHKDHISFERFFDMVEKTNFRNLLGGQRRYVCADDHQVKHIFHYSEINHAWNRMRTALVAYSQKAFGYPIHMDLGLPMVNATGPSADYLNAYSPKLIRDVGYIFREDRRLFNFPDFKSP
jgi:hypothetical protein